MEFIRVLYGSVLTNSKLKYLRKQVRSSLNDERPDVRRFLRQQMLYCVMGEEAKNLLQGAGAKRIELFCDKPLMRESGGHNTWNRLWVLKRVVERHGSVCCTDFDTEILSGFNPKKAKRILARRTGWARVIQIPAVAYFNHRFCWRKHITGEGWDKYSPRKGFNGSFIYLANLFLIDQFLEHYDQQGGYARWRPMGDEQTITYVMDVVYGMQTLRDMYAIEPELVRIHRSPLRELGVRKSHAMFYHR